MSPGRRPSARLAQQAVGGGGPVELGFQVAEALDEGGPLGVVEPLQGPHERGGGAFQPGVDVVVAPRLDPTEDPAAVARVVGTLGETDVLEVAHQSAHRRQVEVQGGGQLPDGDLPLPDEGQRRAVAGAEHHAADRPLGVGLTTDGPDDARQELHQPAETVVDGAGLPHLPLSPGLHQAEATPCLAGNYFAHPNVSSRVTVENSNAAGEAAMATVGEAESGLSKYVGLWVLDPAGTSVEFRTKAMWFLNVKGTFKATGGAATVTDTGAVTGTLVVDAASVTTGNKKRDQHLRTADFFETDSHPTLTFTAKSAQPSADGQFSVQGELTIHGQTRPLELKVS